MYDLQPIRDRETHRTALTEIERLFDAPAGTPEFDNNSRSPYSVNR